MDQKEIDRKASSRRETVTALLAFLWGTQFALLAPLLGGSHNLSRAFASQVWTQALSVACFAFGAVLAIHILVGRTWRRERRAWRLDVAFGYMALVPIGNLSFFAAAGEPWQADALCIAGGLPILLAYVFARIVPAMRGQQPGEEEFP